MSTALRRLADQALTVGAALGLAALLLTALGAVMDLRPLVFRSGSMGPTIDTGSLALAHRVGATDVHVGDIVSVRTASGARVTHRVVGIDRSAGAVSLRLKGDANRAADAETYTADSAYRVFWHAPKLGYAVGVMLAPPALPLVGAALVGLFVLAGRRRRGTRRSGGRHARRRRSRHRGRRTVTTAAATVAVLGGPAGPAAAAPWTDDVVVSAAAFTAGSVPAPAFSCGALGVFSVTFSWTAVSGATSYTLHYGSGGSQTLSTANTVSTIVTAISGGTAWVVANHDYGSTTWSSVVSNTRTYSVAAISLCG